MDYLQILAAVLFTGRLVAVYFLIKILRVQITLLRLPIDPEVWDFRKKLHYMTIALLIGNIPSIILDVAVIAGVDRTFPYLIVYATFNMITMVIAAIMIENMYKLAGNTDEVNQLEREYVKVQNKEKK